jgi:hypothetical protein
MLTETKELKNPIHEQVQTSQLTFKNRASYT